MYSRFSHIPNDQSTPSSVAEAASRKSSVLTADISNGSTTIEFDTQLDLNYMMVHLRSLSVNFPDLMLNKKTFEVNDTNMTFCKYKLVCFIQPDP